MVLVVKNPPVNARYTRDSTSIPGSRGSPGVRKLHPTLGILVWKIPWTEEPDGLQSMGPQRL